MPGKHAPDSPRSFYLSVARTVFGALAVVGVVIAIAFVVFSSGGNKKSAANGAPTHSSTPSLRPSATPTLTASPSPSPTPSLRKRSKVSIVVLNGKGTPGLAAKVQAKLEKAGYNVIRVGNHAPATKTTAFFKSNAEADADALLDRYPEFGRTKPADSSSAKDALITIVLGKDYPV